MPPTEVDLTVYPDDCDAFGHLNQASFLRLFERARWEMLARGPGLDVFTRNDARPVVRKATVEYHASAYPGDVLRFHQALARLGRTSFTLRQTARRLRDDTLVATGEFVIVCIGPEGRPRPVPEEFARLVAPSPDSRGGLERIAVHGVSLAVDIRGSGPAILLIHGYPLDHRIWEPQLETLTGWRRIAPDLRGMGGSDAPLAAPAAAPGPGGAPTPAAEGYSMEVYARDLAALLDRLGVERAVLCAHSMGGYIAFEFLRRWRPRVRGLVLVNTRAEADTPEGRRAREAAIALARTGGAAAVAESMLPKMLAPSAPPALRERVRDIMTGTPVAGLIGALGAMRDRPDNTLLLPALAGLPTLVIAGAEDGIVSPASARAMAAAIPGARLVEIPGAAHLASLEAPEATTEALRSFLTGLE